MRAPPPAALAALLAPTAALAALLAPTAARAAAGDDARFHLGGALKSFSVVSQPTWSFACTEPSGGLPFGGAGICDVLADEPYASDAASAWGLLDFRLVAEARPAGGVRVEAHHELWVRTAAAADLGLLSAGVAEGTTEAVDLSWRLEDLTGADEGRAEVGGRVDRLLVAVDVPHARITAGRQAVGLGHGRIFTPLDLVAPFSPADLDQEHKPGVDAVRIDVFAGVAGRLSAIAVHRGGWDEAGRVVAAWGQAAAGAWDLGLLAADVQGDLVAGAWAAGGVGEVGLHAEATATRPAEGGEPYLRAVVGGDGMPDQRTTLAVELYGQTLGGSDPEGELEFAMTDPRVARGEIWTTGHLYAGLAADRELSPLLHASAVVVANLAEPSALVGPGLSWSAAEEVQVDAGAVLGLGARPEPADLGRVYAEGGAAGLAEDRLPALVGARSEYGTMPAVAWVRMAAWF